MYGILWALNNNRTANSFTVILLLIVVAILSLNTDVSTSTLPTMSIAAAQTFRRALVSSVQVRRNISILLGATSLGGSTVALCEDKSFVDKLMESTKSGDFSEMMDGAAQTVGDQIQGAVNTGIPTQLSYGFVSGYCSGLALKKAGRAAGVVFGKLTNA